MGVSDPPPMGASDPWWAQVTHGRKWLTFHGRKWPPCRLKTPIVGNTHIYTYCVFNVVFHFVAFQHILHGLSSPNIKTKTSPFISAGVSWSFYFEPREDFHLCLFQAWRHNKNFPRSGGKFLEWIGVEERHPFVSLVGLNFHYFGIRFVSCWSSV